MFQTTNQIWIDVVPLSWFFKKLINPRSSGLLDQHRGLIPFLWCQLIAGTLKHPELWQLWQPWLIMAHLIGGQLGPLSIRPIVKTTNHWTMMDPQGNTTRNLDTFEGEIWLAVQNLKTLRWLTSAACYMKTSQIRIYILISLYSLLLDILIYISIY